MAFYDGLINLVSGLGTGRDKQSGASYAIPTTTWADYFAAYKASALVRRAIDLPAEDACREWREWQAEGTDISLIEAEETRLGLRGKVKEARSLARLYGGSAILIGTGDSDLSQPVQPGQVGKGGLRYLTVLSAMDLSAGDISRDPTSPRFGLPEYWTMTGASVRMHPSRFAIFYGTPPMGGMGLEIKTGWGESELSGMLPALRRVDEVMGNINSLVYEAKVDVVKIPGLMQNLAARGTVYSSEVLKRLTLAATGKGINGMLMIDADEEYEQKSASFGGLPEIYDRACQNAAAHAGIPVTRLFGTSPGGMNATGDSDIRGYYDAVKVQQTLHMQPAMAVLDECLIWSAMGNRPPELHYNWRPLWQVSAKEKAENADKLMSAFDKLFRMGVVPTEAIGKAAVNGLTESGAAPGLEGYVAEFYTENPMPNEGGDDLIEAENDPAIQ